MLKLIWLIFMKEATMKKVLTALSILSLLILSACDISTIDTGKTKTQTYEAILDTYSEKLVNATPELIAAYNEEAAKNTEGLMGLATISSAKITELAEISAEGIEEMAELMVNQNGDYQEYMEWSMKLQDVYTNEAAKLTQAYIDSAI